MFNPNKYNTVVRLILVASLISVLATPHTLADYTSRNTPAASGAYSLLDFMPKGGYEGGLTLRNSETPISYVATSPASPKPSAAYVASPPPACTPTLYHFGISSWYEVLGNTYFDDQSCSPNWIFPTGYTLPQSAICNSNPFLTITKSIAVLPYASGFSQNFSVPNDALGAFEIGLRYAIVGTPTANDRIILELREGPFLRSRISIRTDGQPTYCHREDFTFSSALVGGNFARRNLKLRVSSQIVTPGVEFHISEIFTFVHLV